MISSQPWSGQTQEAGEERGEQRDQGRHPALLAVDVGSLVVVVVRVGGATEGVDEECRDVEHDETHQEDVGSAVHLTGDGHSRSCGEVVFDDCLWRKLINNLEEPVRLNQLGETNQITTLHHSENVSKNDDDAIDAMDDDKETDLRAMAMTA